MECRAQAGNDLAILPVWRSHLGPPEPASHPSVEAPCSDLALLTRLLHPVALIPRPSLCPGQVYVETQGCSRSIRRLPGQAHLGSAWDPRALLAGSASFPLHPARSVPSADVLACAGPRGVQGSTAEQKRVPHLWPHSVKKRGGGLSVLGSRRLEKIGFLPLATLWLTPGVRAAAPGAWLWRPCQSVGASQDCLGQRWPWAVDVSPGEISHLSCFVRGRHL